MMFVAIYRRLKWPLQRAENAGKAVIRLLLRAASTIVRPGRATLSAERARRVLYLRDDRIGDIIMATGLLRAIATAHPTMALDVLTLPSSAEMLQGNPHVRVVHRFDKKRARLWLRALWRIWRTGYDVVIDGMIVRPRVAQSTLVLMLASGAPYRMGVETREGGHFTLPVPAPDPTRHHCEQNAVFAVPFGIDPEATDWRPEVFLTSDERAAAARRWSEVEGGVPGRRVLVNVSASQPARQLSEAHYGELVRYVRMFDAARVVVMAAPADAAMARRIAGQGGAALAVPGLREALALVGGADMVITPNTSITHMAAALRKPTVLVQPRGLEIFTAYGAPGRTVIGERDERQGLEPLTLTPVLRAVDEVWALVAAGASAIPA